MSSVSNEVALGAITEWQRPCFACINPKCNPQIRQREVQGHFLFEDLQALPPVKVDSSELMGLAQQKTASSVLIKHSYCDPLGNLQDAPSLSFALGHVDNEDALQMYTA